MSMIHGVGVSGLLQCPIRTITGCHQKGESGKPGMLGGTVLKKLLATANLEHLTYI